MGVNLPGGASVPQAGGPRCLCVPAERPGSPCVISPDRIKVSTISSRLSSGEAAE